MDSQTKMETVVLGGGCFWCTEASFNQLKGVDKVISGYAGGTKENPTYDEVCGGKTGHAEVAKVIFDPNTISFSELLSVFFSMHDPSTLNSQGADVGTQYRSIILYTTDEQRKTAEMFIENLKKEGIKVVTELKPLEKFYVAEDYHEKYFQNHRGAPYCQMIIDPKINKLKEKFKSLLKS